MGSSRLPGKVLKKIYNKPCLLILMERVLLAKKIDKIVIATTKKEADRKIVNFCKKYNFNYFCGSENDVLKRYYDCNIKYKGNTIIRITSDCPLVDPKIIDKTVDLFYKRKVDYAANTIPPNTRMWPDGSDVEVFSKNALEKAFINAKGNDREHVTFYFWKSNNIFKTVQLGNKLNWSKYRYTIDYKEDFYRVKNIVKNINNKNIFGDTKQIVNILNKDINERRLDKKFTFGYGWKNKKLRKKIKFLFRCDAGESDDIGTGHVIRTLRLIEQLIIKKILLPDQITIVYKNFDGYKLAVSIIKNFKYKIKNIQLLGGTLQEEKELLKKSDADVIVFDVLRVRKNLLLTLKKQEKTLISFDELGQGRLVFDKIIYSLITPPENNKKFYSGYDYLNLSNKIIRKYYVRKSPKTIIVTLGGNDKRNLYIEVLECIKKFSNNLSFIFIISNNDYLELSKEIIKRNLKLKNVIFYKSPKNFYELLTKGDIALVAGGITMFEVAAMGIPSIAIPQHIHQIENINSLKKKKITCSINIGMKFSRKSLENKINNLINDYKKRKLMNKKGIDYIDGKGLYRTLQIFKKVIEHQETIMRNRD